MSVHEHRDEPGLAGASSPRPRPDGAVTGFRPTRTLSVAVEMRRQLTRRRTRLALGFLAALPFLLVGAFQSGAHSDHDSVLTLVDLATSGAANFTLFTLFAATGFLLAVVFALFAGDTVASEASWSSLRYLLASPIPRSRLLRQKLVVALGLSLLALVILPLASYVAGGLFFGWAPARTPLGTTIPNGEAATRLVLIVGYVGLSLLFVSALAFLLGVWTDAPLGAVGGAVLVMIVSNILDTVTALGSVRNLLPTHYAYSWTDALGPTIGWESMGRGVLWSLSYSLVALAVAWRHFLRKDVVS